MTHHLIPVILGVTGFLCLLNAMFSVRFRKRRMGEVLSYLAVGLVELAIFGFALALQLRLVSSIPYHLPPGLPFNRAEIGLALAAGIGLFPAAYWHRTSLAQLRKRMAQDAKAMKEREGGVSVHNGAPGEWMN